MMAGDAAERQFCPTMLKTLRASEIEAARMPIEAITTRTTTREEEETNMKQLSPIQEVINRQYFELEIF